MQSNGSVVSFIDVMRKVNDGREEHYVEITEIKPPKLHPIETGNFFPWFPDVYTMLIGGGGWQLFSACNRGG